jgi:hypothetical protein
VQTNRSKPLVLTAEARAPGSQPFPNYLPLWTVAVDKKVMYDHDDFWNPQVVRLISLLFADAYDQTERLHRRWAPE